MEARTLRILLVEDNDADAFLFCDVFEDTGLSGLIDRAETVREGVERALCGAYDFHVVDWRLPDDSGVELVRRAREAGIRTPIVMMTGADSAAVADEALEAGASDFLGKRELDPDRLRRCFRYALEAWRLAERLREHARALEADSLLVVGESGLILFATPAAEELFGRPLTELRGAELGINPTGDVTTIEILRDDGIRSVTLRSAPSSWEAQPAHLVWLRDTTRLPPPPPDRAQESVVGQVAAGIAHDFNNLIGGIIGHLELAGQPTAAADVTCGEHIRSALHTAERAADLTAQLLVFARRTEPELTPLELGAFIAELSPTLRRIVKREGFLAVEQAAGPRWLLADESTLERAVLNLVSNARDALIGSGTRVAVIASGTPDRITLTIEDDGVGMPPQVQAMAFAPFYTTKPPGAGTGLGLPLARKMVESMHGEFGLQTEPGKGTRITLSFPRIAAPKQTETMDSSQPLTSDPSNRERRVLVVDDEASVREVVVAALQSAEFDVCGVEDPRQALELLIRDHFDLVLTDVTMPQMSGFELARKIREARPDQRIALMSGYGHRAAAARQAEQRDYPVLGKPFRLAEVVAFVSEVLES